LKRRDEVWSWVRPLFTLAGACLASTQPARAEYAWQPSAASQPFSSRFSPPEGFRRAPVAPGSFAQWLRELPLSPGRSQVRRHDGTLKVNQAAHLAVVDLDVGKRDLQQCADAVLRLRVEYAWSRRETDALCVPLTSGAGIPWQRWRAGDRPQVERGLVRWRRTGERAADWKSLRSYLDFVFAYAGSASIQRSLLVPVPESDVAAGDVIIQPGYPGHAVLVIDVVEAPSGGKRVALVQSYMPAQDVHVLDNPASPGAPWFTLTPGSAVVTPEWTFPAGSLRRWRPLSQWCAAAR
jgi:hypothetical protein